LLSETMPGSLTGPSHLGFTVNHFNHMRHYQFPVSRGVVFLTQQIKVYSNSD
jgi:hypothetical protein